MPLEASYSLVIRGSDGLVKSIIDDYISMEYTKLLNMYGFIEVHSDTALVDPADFELDDLIEIWRLPPGESWIEDFTAFNRFEEYHTGSTDDETLKLVGPGLEHLLSRRIILPPSGESFLTIENELSDIMRELVRTQCTGAAGPVRSMPGLSVEVDDHAGLPLKLNFRYSNLYDSIIEMSTDTQTDFAVVHTGAANFQFRVYTPSRGLDKRVGNTEGNPPVIFSLNMGNMADPTVTYNRLEEATIAYVAGEGTGAMREVVERSSLDVAEDDSLWNRIEMFLEASQETSTAALMATGDLSLVQRQEVITFECRAVPTPACLYNRDWDIGDLITGYYRGVEYDMKVVEIVVGVSEGGEVITPKFEVTNLQDMVWDYP